MYYKIQEVAQKLGVDRVILYDKLIGNSDEMSHFIKKTNGITYISESGVEYLSKMILHTYGNNHVKSDPVWRINSVGIKERVDMFSTLPETDNQLVDAQKNIKRVTDGLVNDDLVTDDRNDFTEEIEELKNRISTKRNAIVQMDGELKRMNDALNSYHGILTDDMEWLWDIEEKILEKAMSRGTDDDNHFMNPLKRLLRK